MKTTLIQILCCVTLAKATDDTNPDNDGDIDIDAVVIEDYSPTNIMIPKTDSSARIIGGEEVVPHTIPYQAALFTTKGKHISFCGGSLITKQTVLTAAHCPDGATRPVMVVLGAHNIRKREPTKQIFTATKHRIHQGWNKRTIRNDIAVVSLPTPAKLSSDVQLIPLAKDRFENYELHNGILSGWGKTSDKAQTISDVLRHVTLPIISNNVCGVSFLDKIRDTNICTSGLNGKASCNADSGGPLVVNGVQVGIVSFGSAKGCEMGWPGAYTRVTSYLDWLNKHAILD